LKVDLFEKPVMLGKFVLPLVVVSLLVGPAIARNGPAERALVAGERVVSLPLGDGLDVRVLYDAPPHPRATLVMLPGGSGDIGLRRDGDLRHGNNFVVRTRAEWLAKGYAVLIPDTIGQANLRGIRSSRDYGRHQPGNDSGDERGCSRPTGSDCGLGAD
jgi:hypothetical protein